MWNEIRKMWGNKNKVKTRVIETGFAVYSEFTGSPDKNKRSKEESTRDYYNTVIFVCRKCKKELGVNRMFIKHTNEIVGKDNYCKCDNPHYFTKVISVKRDL